MGLPGSAISITIDGVNVQDQDARSGDGFYANVRPQTDMVEQVTVSEATATADSSGQGAVQIKFVTRSGSNVPTGSVYEYLRDTSLMTNSWQNEFRDLPKNKINWNQFGVRQGGPIVIPRVYNGRGKAFFFFNYEEFRLAVTAATNRTMISPEALHGGRRDHAGQERLCIVSAYGYWYNPKDERIFTAEFDEQSYRTPHARDVANTRKKPQLEQFTRLYDVKQREVKKFYDAGGARLITKGTDHPSWGEYLSGFGTHRELQTSKLADLVIVRANPLQDIRNTRNVQHVMLAGKPHDARQLLNSVKGRMGPATAADDEWWQANKRFPPAGRGGQGGDLRR